MIPKPNKPNKVENHRFITLLPVGGKIYERLVKERLRFATEEANLLQDIQTGFRRERNTVDNLIRMQRDIIHALNNGKVMIAVFLDVKGAFDILVHRQILEGLSKAKINGNLMKFTLSYLSDRKIVVTTYKYVTLLLDKDFLVDMVLLELSKAFDWVCHEFFITKPKAGAVDDVIAQWIQSSLSGRTQVVRVHD
ncbi:hypothetical protein QYM36_006769 [Artemia franciscana]|uniref:Reverse transcriptase domain-containing protein n=1 Tax=Artemia franciscana TaxID=6661 RepID=A0AA88I117_ARTSF|nr:hypothetical protein QYM36_006769 [Artemia franciscana]